MVEGVTTDHLRVAECRKELTLMNPHLAQWESPQGQLSVIFNGTE